MSAHMNRASVYSKGQQPRSRGEMMVMLALLPKPGADSEVEDEKDEDDSPVNNSEEVEQDVIPLRNFDFVMDDTLPQVDVLEAFVHGSTDNDQNIGFIDQSIPSASNEVQVISDDTTENVPHSPGGTHRQASTSAITLAGQEHQRRNVCSRTRQATLRFPFTWKDETFSYKVEVEEDHFSNPVTLRSQLEYFKTFFDDKTVDLIVLNSNLYSTQQSGKSVNTNCSEICDFLSIELMMGEIQLPAYTDYWAQTTRIEQVACVMPLKRYQTLRRYLHFVNNDAMNEDRYFKIRPLLENIRKNCSSVEQERRCSVDEMMVQYKGTRAGSRRQYMKSKPKRWGFKMFVRSGVSGIVYDFCIYAGLDTFQGISFTNIEECLGFGAKVVIALCKSIPNPQCTVVYFDNFFSSLELITYLREELGILSLGTLRTNRLRGCVMRNDKALKKDGKGSFQQLVDDEHRLVLVKWCDNRSVILGSSYTDAHPVGSVKRYSKELGRKIDVSCPKIVKDYNMHMGGVDLSDMLVALYRTGFRTHRWYMAIFSQLLDICVNNGWLLYRRELALADGGKKNQGTLSEGI